MASSPSLAWPLVAAAAFNTSSVKATATPSVAPMASNALISLEAARSAAATADASALDCLAA